MEIGGDPVRLYADRYRQQFADLTARFINQAVLDSDIDLTKNQAQVKDIRYWANKRDHVKGRKASWLFLAWLLVIIFLSWGCWLIWQFCELKRPVSYVHLSLFFLYSGLAVMLFFGVCMPKIGSLGKVIESLNKMILDKTEEALELLRPFYGFFDWNTVTKLIEKVLPCLKFDDYLAAERVRELVRQFGLPEEYLEDKSVLFSHSGSFWGYPFLFLETKKFYWGTKTYEGQKTIFWTEQVEDSKGRTHTVSRSQVLTATVTKPYPCFSVEKCFFFGHDAAPHLSFSREPSSLSGAEDSFFTNLSKKSSLRKLRRFSENLTDDSDYTLMSNHDFEVLFHAVNRDHEVEFRMLFTALAQQQMVNLLNDREVGFGDDFHYQKSDCMTMLVSKHLNGMQFSTEPEILNEFDFSSVKSLIQRRYEDFFHRIYFTFAPLMTIPLYNQPRLETECLEFPEEISAWEMESIANYQGERYYQAEDCLTENLLQVHEMQQAEDGGAVAVVTAHGFAGTEQSDYEEVLGGDGAFHSVRVDWVEYYEVQKDSQLYARPLPDKSSGDCEENICRRSLVFHMPQ